MEPLRWEFGVHLMHIDRSGSSFVAMAMLALLFVACGTEAPTATPTTAAAPTVAPPTATPTQADQPLVSPGASKVTIALPAIGIQTMALHTALEGGFFERHGLDVTLTTMSTPMDVMRAVRMGRADLAVVPPQHIDHLAVSPAQGSQTRPGSASEISSARVIQVGVP